MSFILPETELLKIKSTSREPFETTFVFEPLLPGYGVTIGHALRRILLSSLEGSAIWSVRMEGVSHEFSTLPGVKEDMVEIVLNLKTLKLKLLEGEEAVIKINKKGPGEVKAKDIEKNSQIEVIDPEHHLASLDKKGKMVMEAVVRKGRGYVPTESRLHEKLPLGTIALDASFTPIKKINYEVEATRVGARTDFDKLVLSLTTDGTLKPEEALKKACQILQEHLGLILGSDLSTKKDKPTVKTPVAKTAKAKSVDAKKKKPPKNKLSKNKQTKGA